MSDKYNTYTVRFTSYDCMAKLDEVFVAEVVATSTDHARDVAERTYKVSKFKGITLVEGEEHSSAF